jgi:formate dehydrogenase subunit gamma
MSEARIVRYRLTTRIAHWAVALLYTLLFASGFALFHPSFYWMSELFGGGPMMRVLHPFMGVALFVIFVAYGASVARENLLAPSDKTWLANAAAIMAKEKEVPVEGKYNAGQKVMFWLMVACVLGLTASGVLFWRPYFTDTFGADVRRIAVPVHVFFAFLMFAAIGVHVYAAFFTKGSTTAMLRGWVTRAWAKFHYPGWERRVTAGEGKDPSSR